MNLVKQVWERESKVSPGQGSFSTSLLPLTKLLWHGVNVKWPLLAPAFKCLKGWREVQCLKYKLEDKVQVPRTPTGAGWAWQLSWKTHMGDAQSKLTSKTSHTSELWIRAKDPASITKVEQWWRVTLDINFRSPVHSLMCMNTCRHTHHSHT